MIRGGWLSTWIRPSCIGWPTSHLLLQAQYDLDSLLQDDKLGLGLVALQVDLTHPAQLSEGFVNVAHAHPLPSVVSQTALTLPLLLLLGGQVLVSHRDNTAARRRSVGGLEGLVSKPKSQPSLNLILQLEFNFLFLLPLDIFDLLCLSMSYVTSSSLPKKIPVEWGCVAGEWAEGFLFLLNWMDIYSISHNFKCWGSAALNDFKPITYIGD